MVRQGVARRPCRLPGVAVEEAERRQRLEDRRPHGVEVDARRHHRDVGLVRRQLGRRHLADVEALARVLLRRLDAGEHVDVLAAHERGAVVVGHGEAGQLVAARPRLDRLQDLLHRRMLPAGRSQRETLHYPGDMPGSYIVAGARTPIGKMSGALASLSAADLGGAAIAAALERAGVASGRGRSRRDRPGADGRPGPGAQPAGGGQGRHPDVDAVGERQQGLPLRTQRDLPRRPDDRRRGRRHRRRRRHGVDDQRAVPRRRGPRPASATATPSCATRSSPTGCGARSTLA